MKAGVRALVAIAACLVVIGITTVGLVQAAHGAIGDNLPDRCWKFGDKKEAVTVPEWRHITYDITHKELVNLLDGPGTPQSGNQRGFWYPICGMSPKHGRVVVAYDRGEPSIVMWVEVEGGYILKQTL